MRKKLIVLGIALIGVSGALCVEPRNAEASGCYLVCSDGCCDRCCVTSSGAVVCTDLPCVE